MIQVFVEEGTVRQHSQRIVGCQVLEALFSFNLFGDIVVHSQYAELLVVQEYGYSLDLRIDQGAIFPPALASLFNGFSIKNFTSEFNSLIIRSASCNHVI